MGIDDRALSRRGFLGMSVAAAAGGRGAYRLVEQLAESKPRRLASPTSTALPGEQYLFFDTALITDNGVVVSVPPLFHEVVTATLAVEFTPAALKSAQARLGGALGELERSGLLDYTPAGLGLAVCWGLPYFANSTLSPVWEKYAPIDLQASKLLGVTTPALLDSIRFTTDPATSLLEANHMCVVMASDSQAHMATAYESLFTGTVGELFKVTSRRLGFVDATQLGKSGQSLTKRFALANKLPAAASIPNTAELFLGFTSTQRSALGPGVISNLESLGMTNQTKTSYFAMGTTLALSHIYEDLESWYAQTYDTRVAALFTPRIANPAITRTGMQTIPESGSPEVESEAEVYADAARYHTVGHSSSMQSISRLQSSTTDVYGNVYPALTAIPVRADFNTVDHPFAYSSNPVVDGVGPGPVAGLHFLSYVPSSFFFQQIREAMDGEFQDKPSVGAPAQRTAFMNVLETTHRQNYLTPSRAHRSFPLVELLD